MGVQLLLGLGFVEALVEIFQIFSVVALIAIIRTVFEFFLFRIPSKLIVVSFLYGVNSVESIWHRKTPKKPPGRCCGPSSNQVRVRNWQVGCCFIFPFSNHQTEPPSLPTTSAKSRNSDQVTGSIAAIQQSPERCYEIKSNGTNPRQHL